MLYSQFQIGYNKRTLCLDSMQFDAGGRPAAAVPCHGQLGAQVGSDIVAACLGGIQYPIFQNN